jgi:hypothetical protein
MAGVTAGETARLLLETARVDIFASRSARIAAVLLESG